MMNSLSLVWILWVSVMGTDLSKNPCGVSWLDTTDDWGRPWCDAATSFYQRLEDQRDHLSRQGIPAGQIHFVVGTETTLQKVFRPKLWFRGDMSGSVDLEAARGEVEGFQLVICPIADGERLLTRLSDEKQQAEGPLSPKTVAIQNVEVSSLLHEGNAYQIGPENFRIYRVGYIRSVPPQYPVMHVGAWPDPLLPIGPFEVSNPNCQPIWVELSVPRMAPAGDYRGRITVKGPHEVQIGIKLKVWNFALPEPPPMFTMGWALHNWFVKDGIESLLKRLEVLLDHRLAPWHAAYPYHKDLTDFDRIMKLLMARGVKLQATQGKPSTRFAAHLREKSLLGHFVCLWGDEPHERDYPEYRRRTEQIHKTFPGLAVAMTDEPTADNEGLFDVWIAEPSAQDDRSVQEALKRGDRVWWYLCQLPIHAAYSGPIHACPGMVVDRPAIDHRIIYWLAFKQDIEGVSFWAISSWPKGFEAWPEKSWPASPRMSFPYSGQHNANGFLCYPGTDGMPWPSIRLKCIRDGMEDYDYLWLLRQQAGPNPSAAVRELLQIPVELASGLRYYNKDPHVLLRIRRRLAEQIVALSDG